MDAKLLTWKEARIIVGYYFSFWIDGEDKIWAKIIWSALENAGLTIYKTDDEEMIVRSRVAILALIYQEFSVRSELSEYQDANFRRLTQQHYKEIFSNTINQLDEQVYIVLEALNKEYPNGALFTLMYESAFRGSHGSLTVEQTDEVIENVKKIILDKDFCAEYDAFNFCTHGYNIIEFRSIPIIF
jgi:hypothetical protein